ncbi:hypothetical protein, partial [Salmonella sp. s54925]|uniref:hypothetical protein n=1 Tax=Salmonella sp. s54925 TaxID=3159674 RepID=UPI003980FD80
MEEDESCVELYEPVGCFNDKMNARVFSKLVFTDRDLYSKVSSGKEIDWKNFPVYLKSLACRCAKKTQEQGREYFGLQFYGECFG